MKSFKNAKKRYTKARKIPDLENIFQEFISNSDFKKAFENTKVILAWPEIVGKKIANITKAVKYENYILFIKVNDSIFRNEMVFLEKDFIKKINMYFKKKVVTKIMMV